MWYSNVLFFKRLYSEYRHNFEQFLSYNSSAKIADNFEYRNTSIEGNHRRIACSKWFSKKCLWNKNIL